MKALTRMASRLATIIALVALGGCGQSAENGASPGPFSAPGLAAGTSFDVRLTSSISSEHAHVGDTWTGVVVSPVSVGSRVVLAEGSTVHGVVTGAQEARRGSRALLDLAVQEVEMDGDRRGVNAVTEPVIAGSPRARNLGAIAGGAAAGALIGKAVGGDGRDAAVGGLVGGATATGLVAASKGYQVVLKQGTVMTFTVASRS